MPIAFAGFHRGMLSFTKAPITMDITEKRVRFSGPESPVNMKVMSGLWRQAREDLESAQFSVPGLHAKQIGLTCWFEPLSTTMTSWSPASMPCW
jgi:hypothetical protein